ncbi:MAG: hypothetical protein R3D27_05145 [Hyphomicrobiaceae bacterium]
MSGQQAVETGLAGSLTAAERALDQALARVDHEALLLDALLEIVEGYFEAVVASRSATHPSLTLKAAAVDHVRLVLALAARELRCDAAGEGGAIGSRFGEIAGCGETLHRLRDALLAPLANTDGGSEPVERLGANLAYAAYGLTQAQIALSATQGRLAAASALLRGERRCAEGNQPWHLGREIEGLAERLRDGVAGLAAVAAEVAPATKSAGRRVARLRRS